ncbi:hypothetical protein JW851_04785 [Candidatus Woesearchaeota archaeon]|nr:hypothetical protein [Candidatus Woesearchaeota archaeon]
MDIYFIGSIRGGRSDVNVYSELIAHLKNFGNVLSEHIGDNSITELGQDLSDKFIYDRAIKNIKKAKKIVAEVTSPSHGAGF